LPPVVYTVAARLRAAFERRLGPQAGAFLATQAQAAGQAYGVGGIQGVGLRLELDKPRLNAMLRATYTNGSAAQADARFKALGVKPKFVEPRVLAFAELQSAQRVVDITDATARRIQQVVKASINDMHTTKETAAEIQRVLEGASRARAFQIARTEVGTATAFGDDLAARESGLNLLKVWLTAGDGGKRHPSYPGLDGQEREMDQPFDVGGFELMHPLDPNGPAEEVVNCRCVLDYRPMR
jgi:hypothetical protein